VGIQVRTKNAQHATAIGIPPGKWSMQAHLRVKKSDGNPAWASYFHQTDVGASPFNQVF
jgi:hypothetical protein